jgi:hypothetical protein
MGSELLVCFSDALPVATARKGSIRLALRATDINGAEAVVCEVAMSPNIACHVIMALTDAVAEHNDAKACNVYAFGTRKRSKRRKRSNLTPKPA